METVINNLGLEFIDFFQGAESDIHQFQPLSGSYAVIKCKGKFLICFNRLRNQWELPAGKRETNETPKGCAIRELYEETGQKVYDMDFKGLMKSKNTKTNVIKYNPVYYTEIDKLQPFIENNETTQIDLLSPLDRIIPFDHVDFKLLESFH